MTDNRNDEDFTTEELETLHSLPRTRMPSPELEEKIVRTLKSELLITASPVWWRRQLRPVAAVAGLFILICAAFLLGQKLGTQKPTRPSAALFVLFLYGGESTPSTEMNQVKEYSGWIRSVRESGRMATGEKLKDDGRLLQLMNGKLRVAERPLAEKQMVLGGYFLIEAADYREAVSIAAGCPHLKYGGWIELRQIDSI